MGSPGETRALLEQMAWQTRELGLHKLATAQLYATHDKVSTLLFACCYSDV
jgi:hypothetical protein